MTYQIDLMLRNISEDNDFEDDEIIIRTYMERLEQRIAELETTRTCEGCKYSDHDGCPDYDMCERCVRIANDYYEPKEIQ